MSWEGKGRYKGAFYSLIWDSHLRQCLCSGFRCSFLFPYMGLVCEYVCADPQAETAFLFPYMGFDIITLENLSPTLTHLHFLFPYMGLPSLPQWISLGVLSFYSLIWDSTAYFPRYMPNDIYILSIPLYGIIADVLIEVKEPIAPLYTFYSLIWDYQIRQISST